MQLKMFDATILDSAELVADSPKKAFYRIKLVVKEGDYYVEKESGAQDKVLDRRRWTAITMDAAEILYKKKLREKLNPTRKSPRKYREKG